MVRRESYTVDCGTTRHSIHSECLYSDVHLWQRICAKLREQRGVKFEPDNSKPPGKRTYGEPKGEDLQGRHVQHAKAGRIRMSQKARSSVMINFQVS
jgi:hypothetical protein